jgi:hypothetical protein
MNVLKSQSQGKGKIKDVNVERTQMLELSDQGSEQFIVTVFTEVKERIFMMNMDHQQNIRMG